ncbi:cupin domain-containing protein [Arthrobacter mangrovi]|uniref:Cupin type-2 domain-containing protein n=1 Tax=Arthrobacter mangrovi TaxID=2966350 RepID=A0ABQ5MZ32_9MICC|nr:cupin domain-containing protein [Arthrobacter mangrovi]GLB69130.1 hypothetical protein AHIS1636_35730 [Arthrobacter mangrovi]
MTLDTAQVSKSTSPYPAEASEVDEERIYVIRAAERKNLWFLGNLVQPIITSEMTNGQFMLSHTHAYLGSEPPVHEHNGEDEIFYLLEGSVTFWVEDTEVTLGPGDSILMPRNVPHIFQASSEVESRWLNISGPAGLEKFFEDVSVPAEYPGPQRGWRMDPATLERLDVACEKYGITLLPPEDSPRAKQQARRQAKA